MKHFLVCLGLCFLFVGCHRGSDPIEPKINYSVQDLYLKQLPAPFQPLTQEEKAEGWGRETLIGFGFAQELDLYRAVTAFKRARILSPPEKRDLELNYEILLCYYLGQRYTDVIDTFERSALEKVDSSFPAFFDLLIILYDSYQKSGQEEKAEMVLQLMHNEDPSLEEPLALYRDFLKGDIEILCAHSEPYVEAFCSAYREEKKSPKHAQWLSALVPGAGYLYLGQKQSALTAFLLNGLFIAAACHCYQKGEVAAGVILTSFEMGWYFGGIHGAQQEAKLYNERLYERYAAPLMNQHHLFPVLMLQHAF